MRRVSPRLAVRRVRSRRAIRGTDLLQGHRANLPGQVPGVPSAELDRADVAHHVRRSAAVGAVDQAARRARGRCRRGTSTRASACRNSRTTCRSRKKQIDTIVAWVDAGAPQGDPKDLPPAEEDRRRQRVEGRAGRLRSARPRDPQLRIQDAGVGPGRVVPADERQSRSPSRAGSRWSRFVRPT